MGQLFSVVKLSTNAYQFEIIASTMLMRTHHQKICCLTAIQPVICAYSLNRCRELACLVGQTGRRFVTEATLIYSSWRSDSVNVSRDVTFPQHLKRLLRALILSCLIVCWISYDKQTRMVVGGELGKGGGGLWMGIHSSAWQCFAAGSRCFCKLPLCLLQRG